MAPPNEGDYDDSPYQSDTDHESGEENGEDEINQAVTKGTDKEEMLRILEDFEIKTEPGEEIFVPLPDHKPKRDPGYYIQV